MNFPHTCLIEPYVSNDGFSSTYGTPVTSECFYKESLSINDDSSLRLTSAWIALPEGTVIAHNSRITITGGAQPHIRKIVTINRLSDNEVEYIKVILGENSEQAGA